MFQIVTSAVLATSKWSCLFTVIPHPSGRNGYSIQVVREIQYRFVRAAQLRLRDTPDTSHLHYLVTGLDHCTSPSILGSSSQLRRRGNLPRKGCVGRSRAVEGVVAQRSLRSIWEDQSSAAHHYMAIASVSWIPSSIFQILATPCLLICWPNFVWLGNFHIKGAADLIGSSGTVPPGHQKPEFGEAAKRRLSG